MGNVNDPWKSSAKFLLSSFSLHFIAPGLLQACKKAPRYVSNVSAFPSFHYCFHDVVFITLAFIGTMERTLAANPTTSQLTAM